MIPVIAIDGPSGAGKGTLCRLVARNAGFHLLDSGALYRLTALATDRQAVDDEDQQAVARVAETMDIRFEPGQDSTRVLLGDDDVTREIREERIGMLASRVAAYQPVRSALLQRQRDFRQAPGLLADGRDMGTVVFPDAPLKIFLTASAEERARRRVRQLEESGEPSPDYHRILADIERRDEQDRNRASSPLRPADDAIEIDSTALTIEQVEQQILSLAQQRGLLSR